LLLRRLGCTLGQGYIIGKPMPAAELPAWIRENERRLQAFGGAA
jgi:EAL domain-containing protein (putative c-di-GMP-specific phosphodiesterase class I)